MLFYKSYKYRLKPTKEQAAMIESAFSARRFIWNRFLERISKAYKRRGEDCLRDERVEPLQGVPRLHGVVRGACGRPDGGLVPILRQQMTAKFNWGGNGATLGRMKRLSVMLPVTDSGEPDYEYMAEYTQQKREAMLAKYRAYVEERIAELGDPVEIPALDEKEWHEFPLDDIFTVGAGKRLETRNKVPGTRPFIGATDNGNGVTGFVGNDNASKDSNVLGVNYNGAPCIAFYHPYECIFTDDVKRLHLRNYEDNKFVLLFFVSVFAQQRSKYSYGYKFKEQRMLRQKLMLPVTDSGKPDYEYMEQYAKNMILRKYQQYLAFLDRSDNA